MNQSTNLNRVLEMFTKEIYNLALCQSPGVIRLHEVIQCQEGLVLILDHISGGTIWQENMCTSELEILHCCLQISQVLAHLQNKGIVHRDLKPTNILKTRSTELILIDFGWSEAFCNLQQNPREWPGTLEINPPEVLNCQGPYTEKIDNFALGMSLLLFSTSRFICRKKGTSLGVAATHILQCMKRLRTKKPPAGHMEHQPSLWDLFLKLTEPIPDDRLSIYGIYHHPWVANLLPSYIEQFGAKAIWQPYLKNLVANKCRLKILHNDEWRVYDSNDQSYEQDYLDTD